MVKGKGVYHCHGKHKGKLIRKFKTKGEAARFHYVISHPEKYRKRK